MCKLHQCYIFKYKIKINLNWTMNQTYTMLPDITYFHAHNPIPPPIFVVVKHLLPTSHESKLINLLSYNCNNVHLHTLQKVHPQV